MLRCEEGRCECAKLKLNTERLEYCTAIDSCLSRPEQDTHLTGEDSLEGLEGAENVGHEGERGEVRSLCDPSTNIYVTAAAELELSQETLKGSCIIGLKK